MSNLIIQRQDRDNKKLVGQFIEMAPSELGLLSEGLPGLTQPNQVRERDPCGSHFSTIPSSQIM